MAALAGCGGGGGGGGGGGTPTPAPPPAPTAVAFGSAQALWLNASTIAWPGASSANQYLLYASAAATIGVLSNGTVTGADNSLTLSGPTALSAALAARYPQLGGNIALALPASAASQVKSLLADQLVLVEVSNGQVLRATQLQTQGAIDDVYAAAAATQSLGVTFAADETPTFKLWAPTARSVALLVNGSSYAMTPDAASGVWSHVGNSAWTNSALYSYQVQVYTRIDGGTVKTYTVTDPYAVTLNANATNGPAQQAMVADLASAALKPAGWNPAIRPPSPAPTDIVLYELHVRDFSANDPSVNPAHAGKFLAFTDLGSRGMQHLQQLAAAGVTHVHLLPVFDITSVNEAGCVTPAITNTDPIGTGPETTQAATADSDCYNWGYDPHHYGAPAGFYSSDANSPVARVQEFRSLVQSLHGIGLSVVMDVVYNHTAGNFLDQIVPGYYYRLDANGNITTTSCCQDTATEYAMMEKLMTDTLLRWATQYAVDGFRFDTMENIPLAAVQRAQAAVAAAIAPRTAYWYGEGWINSENFVQADQAHLAGTGIGSFNDRIRDAVRGGGPFDGGNALVANQGFVNGACWGSNAGSACTAAQRSALDAAQNLIRVSMAGGLQNYSLNGVAASAIPYNGAGAGYTASPQETINYVGSHDGQTLYDISQYKHPLATASADRARAQVVALGTVLMAQGIPFIHAGDELLRSKGFDQNSYNAGDWFNRIDWSLTTNYIATMGLPPAAANSANWSVMTPFLQSPNVAPTPADIAATNAAVLDLLKVRRSSTMFRLPTAAQINACVTFPDAAAQQDGLIVMRIGAAGVACGDNAYRNVVVLVNANSAAQGYAVAALAGHAFALHPAQAAGADAVVRGASFLAASGTFQVPGRSVAVFVEN
ncbi:MAG: DUF3372 domain-containing protein [Burkholderiales bacterium]|nr:DUF3372 domain-containing protein [Burkholderiales bacterium]